MNDQSSKTITVKYDLYVIQDGENELIESTQPDAPFQFVTGLGFTFDTFEEKVSHLSTGDSFDFILPKEEANGERNEELIFDVDKSIFLVDGKFDAKQIYPGNVIPLMNEEGHRMPGTVVEVKEDKVTIDLNHPLAGKDLHFIGKVIDSHEATPEEIQSMLNIITGQGGCDGCNCDSCGDSCGEHEGKEGDCGCSHCAH